MHACVHAPRALWSSPFLSTSTRRGGGFGFLSLVGDSASPCVSLITRRRARFTSDATCSRIVRANESAFVLRVPGKPVTIAQMMRGTEKALLTTTFVPEPISVAMAGKRRGKRSQFEVPAPVTLV